MRPTDSPYGNRVDLKATPWLIEPLNAFSDPNVHTVVIMSSVQTGKSLSMMSVLAWMIDNQPANCLVVLDTIEQAKRLARNKMFPYLESCGPVSKMMPSLRVSGPSNKTLQLINFGGFYIMVLPANDSALRSHTSRYMLGDEVSSWPAGAVGKAIGRTASFPNKKIWLSSTPLNEGDNEKGDDFSRAWKEGSQEIWSMRCLKCGQHIPVNFNECIKWNDNKARRKELDWDFNVVRETTKLVCASCGYKHDNTEYNVRKMNAGGKYTAFNDNAVKGVRSFRFNKINLDPGLSTWDGLAVEFLRGKREMYLGNPAPFINFFNLSLGEPWNLQRTADDVSITTDEVGITLQSDKTILTAGIDCQLDHYWLAIREWTRGGESVLRLFTRCDTEGDLIQCLRNYGVGNDNPAIKTNRLVGVDTAFRPIEQRTMCARNGWVALRGVNVGYGNRLFSHDIKRTDGSVHETVMRPWSAAKKVVVSRGKRKTIWLVDLNSTELGVLLCRLRDHSHMSLPKWYSPTEAMGDYTRHYEQQIRANMPDREQDKRGHMKEVVKQVRSDDHAFDVEMYCMVQALRHGVEIGHTANYEKKRPVKRALTA